MSQVPGAVVNGLHPSIKGLSQGNLLRFSWNRLRGPTWLNKVKNEKRLFKILFTSSSVYWYKFQSRLIVTCFICKDKTIIIQVKRVYFDSFYAVIVKRSVCEIMLSLLSNKIFSVYNDYCTASPICGAKNQHIIKVMNNHNIVSCSHQECSGHRTSNHIIPFCVIVYFKLASSTSGHVIQVNLLCIVI